MKRLVFSFCTNPNGKQPVRDWFMELSKEERRVIGGDIIRIELGFPIGMPLCRSLGKGLWECRSTLPNGRIARVIFCIHETRMIALNAFIKKTQKTPQQEIDTAVKRMKESGL